MNFPLSEGVIYSRSGPFSFSATLWQKKLFLIENPLQEEFSIFLLIYARIELTLFNLSYITVACNKSSSLWFIKLSFLFFPAFSFCF